MLSKKVIKSIKGKIVMNKKEEYSFETILFGEFWERVY
jgi:hypothetical protein